RDPRQRHGPAHRRQRRQPREREGPREAQEAAPSVDQEEDRREGRGSPVHRRRGAVRRPVPGDPVIPEQPYVHPVADAAIVDAEFAPDPAGAPLQAVPGAAPAGDADLARLPAAPGELAVELGLTPLTICDTLRLA